MHPVGPSQVGQHGQCRQVGVGPGDGPGPHVAGWLTTLPSPLAWLKSVVNVPLARTFLTREAPVNVYFIFR